MSDARLGGRVDARAVRSVAGTIDLPDDDPSLSGADDYVRSLFGRSLSRPMLAKESRPSYPTTRKRKKAQRG